MNKVLLILISLLITFGYSSIIAITDTGENVILNNNGTWEYANNNQNNTQAMETNKETFHKPKESTFLLKSSKNKSAFWINPNKWSFKKADDTEAAEYTFELKGKGLYGMAITEETGMPIETLAKVAFQNALSVAPDMKLVKQEYRMVNDKKYIYLEMTGTLQGILFTYNGYYYSDDSGSTQFLTYSSTQLANKYNVEAFNFLNGLTIR